MALRERIQPPRCTGCDSLPQICSICGDYQCRCIVPWLARLRTKKRRITVRIHYSRNGKPYAPHFIDGYLDTPYPDEEEETEWLLQGGLPRS